MKNEPHVKIEYKEPKLPGVTTSFQKDDLIPKERILSLFPTVSTEPSGVPEGWWDQIRIFVDTGVHLYIYSDTQQQWYHLDF
jgi:hypothetical protein